MATQIPLTVVNPPYTPEDQVQLTTVTGTAADTAGNQVNMASTGTLLLSFENTDAGVQTVTIDSTKTGFGRLADIGPINIPAGDTVMRFFSPTGWEQGQGSGLLTFTCSSVNVLVTAIPC